MFSDGDPRPYSKGSGRMDLAEDILKQPIAYRVIVNRVWAWIMGSGLSLTLNNFGIAGSPPSNPDLLDYLALRFQADGLSIKKLQKLIMMSRTYQLSSVNIEANLSKDPDNRFYWKSNTRRLDAEGVWDYLLTSSGKLDLEKIGGPSQDLADGMIRRGVYGTSSRMFPNTFQLTFDFLTPTISVERRYTTTIPQQRLFFLNSPIVHRQAEALADRVRSEGSEEAQITKAFEIVYQREPTAEELSSSLAFLHDPELIKLTKQTGSDSVALSGSAERTADSSSVGANGDAPGRKGKAGEKKEALKPIKDSPLKSFCWALLGSNEFLYIN
jgi:hypothetical protein